MTDYTWPTDVLPSASEWRLMSNTGAYPSPLSGTVRTVSRGGDRWACSLTFQNLPAAARAELRAFLARLRGQVHRVVLGDHSYTRRGALTANFVVNGASQTGSSLICDGATINITNAMRAGDWITVENYLYMVTADANTDGAGNITLAISPPLRAAPADGATVNITAPTARFLLASNEAGWSNAPGAFSSATVDLIEDILA